VIDDSRITIDITKASTEQLLGKCDLAFYPAIRFVSSRGESLQMKEGCQVGDQLTNTCSLHYSSVWLNATHPTEDGLNVVEICVQPEAQISSIQFNNLFNTEYCQCKRKQLAYIEKCSDEENEGSHFYVYRFFPLYKSLNNELDSKECSTRYCFQVQPGMTTT